ncbi:MAG: transglycosylase domain-containing protein, partial [Anaerococcus sp.]
MSKKISAIVLKVILIAIFILGLFLTIVGGLAAGSILEVMKTSPEIDPESIKYEMSENSTIVDKDGNELESIRTSEYREIIDYEEMPQYLKDAFVAVEDERFYEHSGIDPLSIVGSMITNIEQGSIVRGGSTLTQQLARNTYLSNDQTYERKIKEIYLALNIEDKLSKDEILEAYMNRVFLGQNSYGVQAAARTYFDKEAKDLSLAECAAIAGIVQSPTNFALYKSILTSEITDQRVLGDFSIDGQKYSAVYNQAPLEREKYVLKKMLENGYINESQYQDALSEDIASEIQPPKRNIENTSSYFNTLLEKQVVEKLMSIYNINENQAWDKLNYGGLKITTTVDSQMQKKLEDVYNNFSSYIIGSSSGWSSAPLLDLKYDNYGNILSREGNLIYWSKNNILNDNNEVKLRPDEAYYNDQGDLIINSYKLKLNQTNLTFGNYYTLDEENSNLRTHKTGSINFSSSNVISKDNDNNIKISKSYLNDHNDMIIDNGSGFLSFNKDYYDIDLEGVIQPQASTVIVDQKTGQIQAIMGGRNQQGIRTLNRASSQPRQPGSSIKPIATYTPALDNGYNLATGIDDVPFMRNEKGEIWPENVYKSFKGIVSLRESIEFSINTNAVRTLDDIGIDTSKKYLKNFGIIKDDPDDDNFVSKEENSKTNDENLAALGLGAMTKGLTTLDMVGAYQALANGGEYIEPLTFSKIEDSNGKTIFTSEDAIRNKVTSPQTAYQMTSALKSTAESYGTINLNGNDFAAKTGTTDNNVDFWCMGYTPQYTVGLWVGADNQNLSLSGYSYQVAGSFWSTINQNILEGKEVEQFIEPEGIVHAKVDTISGKLPTQASWADPRGTVKDEIFSKDNLPTEEDDVHVWKTIDSRNNLLASMITPDYFKVNRSF